MVYQYRSIYDLLHQRKIKVFPRFLVRPFAFKYSSFLLVMKEGKVVDIKNDVTEFHFGCHRVAMINHRFTILSIPAVNCGVESTQK